MRFEVVVTHSNFYKAKMSPALKLPALLGIGGIWQVCVCVWGGAAGTSGKFSVSGPREPAWQGNQGKGIRAVAVKLILITQSERGLNVGWQCLSADHCSRAM